MNHGITWGDLLRAFAGIGGIIVAVGGFLAFLAGAFANPETAESDRPLCRKGLTVMAVGAVIVAAILLTGCKTVHTADFLATPADRLVCQAAGSRPKIPPEYQIDWSKVATVADAHAEHDKYVAVIRTREGIVAGYVLEIEGKLFTCANNVQWRRDWEAELAKTHKAVQR